MDYKIDRHRLNNVIKDYLEKNYSPNFGWNSHDYYKEHVSNNGEVTILVKDSYGYFFSRRIRGNDNTLLVRKLIVNELTDLFSYTWIPVLREWFKENTGLEPESIGEFSHYSGKLIVNMLE